MRRTFLAAPLGLLFSLCLLLPARAQTTNPIGVRDTARTVITTAVPFLQISPDARSAGMGDVGAAISPDVNAQHWNPAKLAFVESQWGLGISYSPWLQRLVNDMSLSYLSGYYSIDDNSTVAASLRYFDMGELQFTDINGNPIQDFNPREFAFDASYARKLSEKFSMAVAGRFIHSNLAGNISNSTNPNNNARPGNTAAADIAAFYQTELGTKSFESNLALGINISNIGPRISYNNPEQEDYIPTNLRLGAAWNSQFDEFNKLTLALDINKLLVPTPPITDRNGNIVDGRDPDRPLISAIFTSFADAPGGAGEEFREIIWTLGAEYWYNDLLALRAGYFYEHEDKGNRQYLSLGAGLRYQAFGFDFAYLIPNQQNHPLGETLRFSLLFKFGEGSGAPAPAETQGE